MPAFDACTLARWSAGRWTVKPTGPVTGFAIDSRQLRAGDAFVALRTDRRDGHDYLAAAAEKGAVAAIVERPIPGPLPQLVVADPLRAFQAIAREHRLAFPGRVIGITGSAGKTSTKHLLAQLLGPAALATEGNLNNHLGVPLTLTRLDPSVHQFAVIEAGISEPGEMAVLAGMIEPDAAIVTLVAAAHTQDLGGIEGVAREKAVLAAAVRAEGVAFLPRSVAGHEVFRRLQARLEVVDRVDAASTSAPDAGAIRFGVAHDQDRTYLEVRIHDEPPLVLTLPRMSDGMAQNAVLAVAAARWLGVAPEQVQERLAQWAPPPLRGEVRRTTSQLLYLDCYNANPASMRDALAAFDGIAPSEQPRLYVIGCMEELGAEAARYHRELGQSLQLRPRDHACIIGSEADAVRAGAIEAGARPEQVDTCVVLAPIVERLAGFRGAVFVKGSRKYRLEEILVGTGHAPATLGAH